ncbi:MAG TPA: c-type cytochrome [Terriglobales bacterium]|nr:c-type cytochrome [Terriglobales bacterium]
MGKFVLGLVIGLLIVPVAVYFYFATGQAPVATSAHPMPFETMLAKKALRAKIEKEMPKSVPMQPDENNLLGGVQVYADNCAVCHGLPGQHESNVAHGMFPYPPQLFKGKGVTDDPPQETFWKVQNGIRMTGMPGFKGSLGEPQLWQVSLLLANANKLPPSAQDKLKSAQIKP